MSRPNLFLFATKELSQDGFLAWLIQWADASNSDFDPVLHEAAQSFVRLLLDKEIDEPIETVVVGRQWEHIDIWAECNGKEALIIEDKTWTGEHSNQLARYRKTAEEHYIPRGYKLHFIYLKTGNESVHKTKAVSDQGYRVIDRAAILDCLNKYEVQNDIYKDYLMHLNSIEKETGNYFSVQAIHKSWRASEGFYLRLQMDLLPEWSDWGYVANASGGFLGFWYHWKKTTSFSEIFIQIENGDTEVKLVVKVSGTGITTLTLYQELPVIQKIGSRYGLTLTKPTRYRAGNTSTLCVVDGAFNPETFSVSSFIATLRRLEKVLDEFSL